MEGWTASVGQLASTEMPEPVPSRMHSTVAAWLVSDRGSVPVEIGPVFRARERDADLHPHIDLDATGAESVQGRDVAGTPHNRW